MRNFTTAAFTLMLALSCIWNQGLAQNDMILYHRIQNSSMMMYDNKIVKTEGWDSLYRVPEHPVFDRLLTDRVADSLLNIINTRKQNVGDTLFTADLFYIWKPYIEWMYDIDPHYSVTPVIPARLPFNEIMNDSRKIRKDRRRQARDLSDKAELLPLHCIDINDTLIVTASNVPQIKKGDIIYSVNGISIEEILKYSIQSRHIELYMSLLNYYYHGFDESYAVSIIRNGKKYDYTVSGYDDIYRQRMELYEQEDQPLTRYFNEASTGYMKIVEFLPDNSKMIKDLRNHIIKWKSIGCKNIIIDLRNNPGGNGADFDRLLAIFIDKPDIPFSKAERLKVSEQTLHDYGFISTDMLGKLIDLPDKYVWKRFPLKQKEHICGLKYYVMMDKGTESTAAMLCNILQYNDGAILAGEPLLRNAWKYGDVLDDRIFPISLGWLQDGCISTVESDLYTKAVDGVLMPDISIPYMAKDYLSGKDAMLEKLLEIIKAQN